MVDLDPAFQTVLPNSSASVIAPGPSVLLTLESESEGAKEIQSTVLLDELLQNLTAQITTGGAVSPIGRLELEPSLGQPFYIVPSETQRPRAVAQTLIQNAIVLQVGNFPLEDDVADIIPEEDCGKCCI